MSNADNSINERSGNFHLPDVEIPEGVSIQLTQEIPRSKQLAEFYSNGVTCETFATITYLDRKVKVDCCGEMLLTFPSMIVGEQSDHVPVIVKYADQLEAAGIKDDTQLDQYFDTILMSDPSLNPWWEVFAKDEDNGEKFDSFYEALDAGIEYISDDANWG
jgi:hypothetical protein